MKLRQRHFLLQLQAAVSSTKSGNVSQIKAHAKQVIFFFDTYIVRKRICLG